MTVFDSLRSTVDKTRAILGKMGGRPFRVWLYLTTWSGTRTGEGTKTQASTELTVDGYAPKVRQLSERDQFISGGTLQAGDIEVTLTPTFPTGGYDPLLFDPVPGSTPNEMSFKVTGPGLPANGAWFKKIAYNAESPLTLKLTLRKTGRTG